MAGNHVLLETIELTQNAGSVVFDNIPQTGYTDLKLVGSVRTTNASTYGGVDLTFNGSTTGYAARSIEGGDGTTGSYTNSTTNKAVIAYVSGGNATANAFGHFEIYIPNYRGSSYKSFTSESAGETNAINGIYLDLISSIWTNTAAITSITLSSGNTLAQYSTFSLYGIAATGTTPAIAPKATGGNIVANDGTYWYHAFLTSGNFVPQTNLTCNYLVVAGGGGGAGDVGGGGGAGGLRSTVTATGGGGSLESPLNLTSSTSYAVTVGAGGAGGASAAGSQGSNSVFSTITSLGGGYGGRAGTYGNTGGSGGGGSGRGNVTGYIGYGGAGTANQGYAGGNGVGDSGVNGQSGGGGGGAGAAGATSTVGTGGAGGAGVAISTFAAATNTGVSNYYAGGGGGAVYTPGTNGAGGLGGGGTAGSAGISNTGSGGGGSIGGGTTGGNGASGIVIIRYPMA